MYGHSMGYKHSMLTDDLLKRKSGMDTRKKLLFQHLRY